MRTIYIDEDFKCHLEAGVGREAFETDFFDGKCDAFVQGYRCVPPDRSWEREDGVVFQGEMYAPIRSYELLKEFQEVCEQVQNEYVGVIADLVESVYQDDLGILEV